MDNRTINHKRCHIKALDWDNLTEEIESLRKEQLRAVESYLKQLIAHQFTLQYIDDPYSRNGWIKEINNIPCFFIIERDD